MDPIMEIGIDSGVGSHVDPIMDMDSELDFVLDTKHEITKTKLKLKVRASSNVIIKAHNPQ